MSEKSNRIERYFDIQARSASEENDKMVIEGYALKFDKETELWKGFNEVIDRTALNNTEKYEFMKALGLPTKKQNRDIKL